jgi:phospholipid-binding lipoprotein MlaA
MTYSVRATWVAAAFLTGLGLSSVALAQGPEHHDPIEPINRGVFGLNDVLDTIAFKPISAVWNTVVPKPVRTGVGNVFSNLDDVFIGANHLLQGRGKDAMTDFSRVLINSTVGVGGLIDVASTQNLQKGEGDFGQTLGVWGVGPGFYLVLPLMGPSTARDTIGRAARVASDPRTYMADAWSYSLIGLEFVQIKADNVDNANLIDSSSLDKYAFTRNLYLQRRAAIVQSGRDAAGAR